MLILWLSWSTDRSDFSRRGLVVVVEGHISSIFWPNKKVTSVTIRNSFKTDVVLCFIWNEVV